MADRKDNRDLEIRRNNRSPGMFDLMPEFEDMVESFFGSSFNSLMGDWPGSRGRSQSAIHETEKCYILNAEIPGVPKEDIDISVNGNLLTVKAEQKQESGRENQSNFSRRYRSFQQSFSLPTTIDPEQIQAHYENGLLEIVLPKTERAQSKKIEVQSGQGSLLKKIFGRNEQTSSTSSDQSQATGLNKDSQSSVNGTGDGQKQETKH